MQRFRESLKNGDQGKRSLGSNHCQDVSDGAPPPPHCGPVPLTSDNNPMLSQLFNLALSQSKEAGYADKGWLQIHRWHDFSISLNLDSTSIKRAQGSSLLCQGLP